VSEVTEDSPAEKAGLRQGDVIVSYNGTPIADPAALQKAVTSTAVGTKATLTVLRDSREQELTVTIGEQPDTAKLARATDVDGAHAFAGLEVQRLDRQTARELGLRGKVQGVVIVHVEPDSVADRAGLTEGDVIQEINRKPITSVRDFEQAAATLTQGQDVLLLIHRRGASLFVSVKI
jgi:serine protease Do